MTILKVLCVIRHYAHLQKGGPRSSVALSERISHHLYVGLPTGPNPLRLNPLVQQHPPTGNGACSCLSSAANKGSLPSGAVNCVANYFLFGEGFGGQRQRILYFHTNVR